MSELIMIGLIISACELAVLINLGKGLFSIRLTPFFMIGTAILLLLTLILSAAVPFIKIIKIHPAEVIS